MVHLVDEGSQFDASIDMIWKFLGSPMDHQASHPQHKNMQAKPLAEDVLQVSWEQEMSGKPVKVVNRVTMIPPVGMVIEMVEGPLAGSKFFNYYTPKGARTAVTIVGDFRSPMLPESQIEPVVRQNFDHVFAQDSAALKQFSSKK
jgi:hypothetical protein